MTKTKIEVFEGKKIRRHLDNRQEKWVLDAHIFNQRGSEVVSSNVPRSN